MPISDDVTLGEGVQIPQPALVNLYGCKVGDGTRIGAFVEIQRGAEVGARCKVSSHSFVCEGVHIADEVFIGHGVMFINDRYPRATKGGRLQTADDWVCIETFVESGVTIGSAAVIMCGIRIGANAMIGAGAVVTKDVPAGAVITGVPGRLLRMT